MTSTSLVMLGENDTARNSDGEFGSVVESASERMGDDANTSKRAGVIVNGLVLLRR